MSGETSTGRPTLPAGAGNQVVARRVRATWSDLVAPQRPPTTAVLAADQGSAAAAAWGHVRADATSETLVSTPGRVDDEQRRLLREDGFAIVEEEGTEPPLASRPVDPGCVWLLTSGSTGRPKRVAHTLASLTTVGGDQPPRRWLCPYVPGTYAWWQLVTLSLTRPGQDVVFVEQDQLPSWPDLALAEGVTAASGTPTFWRQALWLSGSTLASVPLLQVTLGGEPVDQAVLDQLRNVFPAARISWIYASSEAGASVVVHDGKAGFPRAWLEREAPGRPRLSVQDDELLIEPSSGARGIDGVLRTGDRVRVEGDRVYITGRTASDEINVGGSKASAGAVRDVLLAHPGVRWAQVRGRRAPLVGQVVVADVVVSSGGSLAPVDEPTLQRWCADRLPPYAVPRRLSFLQAIPIKETLKSDV